MTAENKADGSVLYECCDSLCASEVGGSIVDQQPTRNEKVPRKEQASVPVVKRDLSLVVARCGDGVDDSAAEIDLHWLIWPIFELIKLANALKIESDNLNVGQMLELGVALAVVEMTMSM